MWEKDRNFMEIIQIKLSVTICFLIKNQRNYVMVDTGYDYDWDLFRKELISHKVRRIFPAHGKPFAVEKLVRNIGKIKPGNF